jgi:hypothetical protein
MTSGNTNLIPVNMGPEVILKYTPASIPGLYLPYTGKKIQP